MSRRRPQSQPKTHSSPHSPSKVHPRIALACDWLTTPGGAEKVLLTLHELYPDAPIYTSQYRPHKITWFQDATVHTGWLNLFPATFRKILGPLRQLYFSHLDLSDYDVVISVTGAEAKAIKTKSKHAKRTTSSHYSTHSDKSQENDRRGAYHLCYCHVPTQYYWQLYDQYLENPGFGFLNPLVRLCFKLFVRPLRSADYRAAQRPDQFVAISHYAADQIREYYHRDAKIVHPPVDVKKFSTDISTKKHNFSTKDSNISTEFSTETENFSTENHKLSTKNDDISTENRDFSTTFPQDQLSPAEIRQYFIISCRQVTWKRVDLAIQACLAAKQPLLVVGDGSEHARLVALAHGSPLIKFIPWIASDQLAFYLQHARAYLFPSLEPFGIAAVEALAAGCPVIAYAAGGSRDFVQPGENGLLFDHQTVDSLVSAIHRFDSQTFDRQAIRSSARCFSAEHFSTQIRKLVDSVSAQRQLSDSEGSSS